MVEAKYKREFRRTIRVKKALDYSLEIYLTKLTPMFDKDMGHRLAKARAVMGVSQHDFGTLLGLSQSAMCRLEAGRIEAVSVSAQQFKSALGTHFQYVLTGSLAWKYEDEKDSNIKKLRGFREVKRRGVKW